MPASTRIHCQCGGELRRPIPRQCPHCGATITALRRRLWPRLLPGLIVGGMFALLSFYVWWLTGG